MRIGKTRTVIGVFFLCMLGSGAAVGDEVVQATPGEGLTIYLDVGILKRPNRASREMTKLHATHFEKGWTVVDVDPYIENGDLQGFFITYVGRDEAGR